MDIYYIAPILFIGFAAFIFLEIRDLKKERRIPDGFYDLERFREIYKQSQIKQSEEFLHKTKGPIHVAK